MWVWGKLVERGGAEKPSSVRGVWIESTGCVLDHVLICLPSLDQSRLIDAAVTLSCENWTE